MNSKPTKAQREAINAAYRAIEALSDLGNHSDPHAWQQATLEERRQGLNLLEAKANCVKAWSRGANNPDAPLRDVYFLRDGYMRALMLGVRQSIERAGCEYTAPHYNKAFDLCAASNDAWHVIMHGGK